MRYLMAESLDLEFTITPLHEGTNSTVNILPELDDYAFFHSTSFKKIVGKRQKDAGVYESGWYLKISNGKKSIYLKYHQLSNVKGAEVKLSYRNSSRIDAIPGTIVNVKKVSWLAYNWNNSDVNAKWNFRASLMAFAALFLIELPEFVITLIQFCR